MKKVAGWTGGGSSSDPTCLTSERGITEKHPKEVRSEDGRLWMISERLHVAHTICAVT